MYMWRVCAFACASVHLCKRTYVAWVGISVCVPYQVTACVQRKEEKKKKKKKEEKEEEEEEEKKKEKLVSNARSSLPSKIFRTTLKPFSHLRAESDRRLQDRGHGKSL